METSIKPHHTDWSKVHFNPIGDIMVSVLTLECGKSLGSNLALVKPRTIKLVFVASPLSMQH
jgi:hypothetical protein